MTLQNQIQNNPPSNQIQNDTHTQLKQYYYSYFEFSYMLRTEIQQQFIIHFHPIDGDEVASKVALDVGL